MAKLYKPQNEKGHDLVAVSEINNSDLKIDNSFLNITDPESEYDYESGDNQKLVTAGTFSKTLKKLKDKLEDSLTDIIAENDKFQNIIENAVGEQIDNKIEETKEKIDEKITEIQDTVNVLHQTVEVTDKIDDNGKVTIYNVKEQNKFFIAAYVEEHKDGNDFIPFFPNVDYKNGTIELTFADTDPDSINIYKDYMVKLIISQTVAINYNAQPLPPVNDGPIPVPGSGQSPDSPDLEEDDEEEEEESDDDQASKD